VDDLDKAQEVAWYATLPTMFGSAAALFTDPAGRVLLVKPNYRDHWSLPGGILEHGEPPDAGCCREVSEELGIVINPGPLLVVSWVAPDEYRPKPLVSFVFDGGELDGGTRIVLQESELDDYRFVGAAELGGYLPPFLVTRVITALRSRAAGAAAYLAQATGLGRPGRRGPRGSRGSRGPDL
jgi:8-oxo-dGTP diphosphatase